MSQRRSVAVRLMGREYRIRSDADEEQVQRVARYVDETLARIRERTRTVDSLDLALLTALNLANDLLAERAHDAPAAGATPERVQALAELAESAVAEVAEA